MLIFAFYIFTYKARLPLSVNYNPFHKSFRQMENRPNIPSFFCGINCVIFNGKPKEAWKRVWSRSLGYRPLRTSGFNELEVKPKFPRS